MNYKQKIINQFATDMVKAGACVFISGNGEYGFMAANDESPVISFHLDFGVPVFSANYKRGSRNAGTGFRFTVMAEKSPKEIFKFISSPIKNQDFATIADHLETYGKSSRYQEFLLCE